MSECDRKKNNEASSNSGKFFSNTATRLWLEEKRNADDLDGLWRIHDNLYDVTEFINKHPGGRFWLESTKGMDITEAFETHHIKSDLPEYILKKFFVKEINKPRVSPYTFNKDGFYKTLKKNVRAVLETLPEDTSKMSNVYTDLLLLATFAFACLANAFPTFFFIVLAAIPGSFLIVASHNFVHQRDNIRMYYGNVVMMSPSGLRVTHILSHHLFPNSKFDLQLTAILPLVNLYPEKKSFVVKYLIRPTSLVTIFPFLLHLFYLDSILEVILHKRDYISGLLPLTLPIAMHWVCGNSITSTFITWQLIVLVSSVFFSILGYTTTHAHPDLYAEGDAPRPKGELDWGINQLDSVYDRTEIVGNHFTAMVSFGDHALHHFFPTLDQSYLKHLYPVLQKTLSDFNIKTIHMTTSIDLFLGFFKQAGREMPKTKPPTLEKAY